MDKEVQQELEDFESAIRKDYADRVAEMKTSAEERLSDIVISKRMKIEKEVEKIRESHRRLYRIERHKRQLRLKQCMRNLLMDVHSEIIASIGEEVRLKIVRLKQSQDDYRTVLDGLIDESARVLNRPFILHLEKEDMDLFSDKYDIIGIKEMGNDMWGGCVLEVPSPENILIDNTLKTRWKRLIPNLSERLSHDIDQFLEPAVQKFSRELRLS